MKTFEQLINEIGVFDKEQKSEKILELLDDSVLDYFQDKYILKVIKVIEYRNCGDYNNAFILGKKTLLELRCVTINEEIYELNSAINKVLCDCYYDRAYENLVSNNFIDSYNDFNEHFNNILSENIEVPKNYFIIKETIKNINIITPQSENTIVELMMKLLSLVINFYTVIEYKPASVVHYTNFTVAQLILLFDSEENKGKQNGKIQFGDASSMNDPQEGEILIKFIADNNIENTFNFTNSKDTRLPFIGSFMPAINEKETHEDDLVMWRTYGKDELGNEAKGCSLVFDKSFFDEHKGIRFRPKPILYNGFDYLQSSDNNEVEIIKRCDTLFNVVYFDKRKQNFILENENNELIKNILKDFKQAILKLNSLFLNEKNENIKNCVTDFIYHSISYIRYFIKSADYAYESEVRVIHFEEPTSERIIIKDKRLYVESDKIGRDHILRMNIAPKVENPNKWKFLEVLVNRTGNINFKVNNSNCRFR